MGAVSFIRSRSSSVKQRRLEDKQIRFIEESFLDKDGDDDVDAVFTDNLGLPRFRMATMGSSFFDVVVVVVDDDGMIME